MDVVGFAELDTDYAESYSSAIQVLKKLYLGHSSEWADSDITLVFCAESFELITDEFIIEKEQDPYFCRKFFIDLEKDIKYELSRLPFLPLSPESAVDLRRPDSAQTFLIKRGLESELARNLVVPHTRSKEGIISDCLKGKFGRPVWHSKKPKRSPSVEDIRSRSAIRLKKLEINNFRAYRGNHIYDLDADVIVLFGPNGLGKTSFFDAIDFACTGGVARLDYRLKQKPRKLANILVHLDEPKENSYVKMSAHGDNEISIERSVGDRKKALLNGFSQSRSKILMGLTGISKRPIDLRVENFVNLFRATHFFGQEFSSLTSELHNQSKLPEDIVSRMFAFQDYFEAIKKTNLVIKELKKRVEKKNSEIDSFRDSLESIEKEIAQLENSTKVIERPDAVELLGEQITEKISSEQSLSIEFSKEFNQEVIRGWRASIRARIDAINRDLKAIKELKPEIPDLMENRQILEKRIFELNQEKEELVYLEKDCDGKKKKMNRIDEELNQMLSEEKNLSLKHENLKWHLQKKKEYEQLKAQIEEFDKKHHEIQNELSKISLRLEKLKPEKMTIIDEKNELISKIETLEEISNKLDSFRIIIPEWIKTKNHEKRLRSQLSEAEHQYEGKKKILQTEQNKLNDAINRRDKWNRQLNDLQKSQSELKTLLDNLEKHILTDVCPVCGKQHKSREELIEKLKLQKGKQPKQLEEALEALENSENEIEEFNKQVIELENNVKRVRQEIADVNEELSIVQENVKNYVDRSITLGFTAVAEDAIASIDSSCENISKQLSIKRQELSKQEIEEDQQEKELLFILNRQRSMQDELQDIRSKKMHLESLVNNIREDASDRRVSLELEKEDILKNLEKILSSLEDSRKKIQEKQIQLQAFQKETNHLINKMNFQKRGINELKKQILDLSRFIEEREFLMKRSNLNSDMERLTLQEKLFIEERDRLNSLLREVTDFEIALDAAQMSASLAREYQRKEEKEEQIEEKDSERQELERWRSYFSNIRKELQSIRDQALDEYTTKYGPLASTIQRRLRSVYSFGKIELHPERGGITVRVERKEKKGLFPRDYFSASQLNIAALSLFLSSTLTQTWSSFGPILLDDPVTHFDDLNTYTFIDFIEGLLMDSETGKYQLIISTCEERFFDLMYQRLSRLNKKTFFYVFESIGENGPKVKRL